MNQRTLPNHYRQPNTRRSEHRTPPNTASPFNNNMLRPIISGVAATLGLAIAAALLGPRNRFGPNVPTPQPAPPTTPAALEDWLRQREAAYKDIVPGTEKCIIWNSTARTQTQWAVAYLHGFSASRMETAPLADTVAAALGANLFYARLTGHGRGGAAMREACVQDWLADGIEAVRIARTLGKRVLVISCSTGATLATWLALHPELCTVDAHVFISPNFKPRNKLSGIFNWPWGLQIALAVQGPIRSWPVTDPQEAAAWSNHYATQALLPLMALVRHVRQSDLSAFQAPVLMLYSERDNTVDPRAIRAAYARIGSQHKAIEEVTYSTATGQHVLAGDIKAPQATAPMAASIVRWVNSLPASTG